MRMRHYSVTIAIGLCLGAMLLGGSAPVIAEQGKIVLAQIVNTSREPVPVVDVGGSGQTTLVFDQEVLGSFTGVDVAAFGRIRVVAEPTGISDCTVELFLSNPSGAVVKLGELAVTGAQGATAVYDLPGQSLRVRTFRPVGDCSTRVAIYGRS